MRTKDKPVWRQILENREKGITIKRAKRRPDYDSHDKSTWSHKCIECGAKMVYIDSEHNPRYLCQKCGNILEV